MKSLNGAVVVAAWGALAVGGVAHAQGDWQWIPIADSEADFSAVQGQGGWYYLFATSEQDPGNPMPVFNSTCWPMFNPSSWFSQCGSYCSIRAADAHPNAGTSCGAPMAGLQIPVRRYTPPSQGVFRVSVLFAHDQGSGPSPDGVRVSLRVDGVTLWVVESTGQAPFEASTVHSEFLLPTSAVDVRSHPKGGCNSDGHGVRVTVEALDCNGDGIVDYEQILDGTFADINENGVPDTCECIADLTGNGEVNGADISVLLGFWGKVPEPLPSADINRDGLVDGLDLAVLLGSWGPCQ